jgi:hypothetical protein
MMENTTQIDIKRSSESSSHGEIGRSRTFCTSYIYCHCFQFPRAQLESHFLLLLSIFSSVTKISFLAATFDFFECNWSIISCHCFRSLRVQFESNFLILLLVSSRATGMLFLVIAFDFLSATGISFLIATLNSFKWKWVHFLPLLSISRLQIASHFVPLH